MYASQSNDRMNATNRSYTSSYSSLPRRTSPRGRIQRHGTPDSPTVRGLMSQSAKFAGEYGAYGFQDGLEIYVFEYFLEMSLDDKRAKKKHKTFVELQELKPWSTYALKEKIPKADEIFFRPNPKLNTKIFLWFGDITSLCADAIVNPANGTLMGGSGLNGEIHSRAGPLLREECREHHILPGKRLIRLETGYAIVTCGYWLPAKYVIHTVGPTVNDTVREVHQNLLSSCYHECLDAVKTHNERYRKIHNFRQSELIESVKNKKTLDKLGLKKTEVEDENQAIGIEYSEASQGNVFLKPPIRSIAFPCISTGIYGYPHEQAADVALMTVRKWLDNPHNYQEIEELEMIIFCVMIENERRVYNELLPKYFPIHDGKLRKTSHVSSPPRAKAKVAAAAEKRTALNKATAETFERKEQQQTKTTTFSSSPQVHHTEQTIPTTPVTDRSNDIISPPEIIQPPEIVRNEPTPPILTRNTSSHVGHAEVVIIKSASSPQQSSPPVHQPILQVQQPTYTLQTSPQSQSRYGNQPASMKSPKHQEPKKSKEQKKEEQFAKKEAKLLKKQQAKMAKKNKKDKKFQETDDFAPMEIDFDDELMGPSPVRHVAPSPVQKVVAPPPVQKLHTPVTVQRTHAPPPVHASPPVVHVPHASSPANTSSSVHAPYPVHAPSPIYKVHPPSPVQHERGKAGYLGRTPQIDHDVSIHVHKAQRDSNDADIDDEYGYDDDNDDDDMPPPPGSYDDVFNDDDDYPPPPRPPLPQSYPPHESDLPPPPPQSLPPDDDLPPPLPLTLPPPLSDDEMDGMPENIPHMSIVTTIY